jgi:hypothetical protein
MQIKIEKSYGRKTNKSVVTITVEAYVTGIRHAISAGDNQAEHLSLKDKLSALKTSDAPDVGLNSPGMAKK